MNKEIMKNIALCIAGKYESTNCVKCGVKVDLIDIAEENVLEIETTWKDGSTRKVLIPTCEDCFYDIAEMLTNED